ncbi:DUF4369 domain-containing protein [Myroides odoratus]|uniref:DUF4369 domain-containing protein n=1 Tax=Myroides odoratus TaxID=256 RepID=A0A378RKB5_MYROD|nr:DUF4369 domain-containing protein [Myroides odoratus]QQU02457.1 DUF4369 domain-containing protein [Myroides odoratus]STZ26597.1 Uncharacterised protein [Myroides odoratus]
MKKHLQLLLLGIAVVFTACNSKTQFEIEGTLAHVPDGEMIYLNKVADTNANELIKLDSIVVQNEGFKFMGKIEQPTLGFLTFRDQKGRIPLFIENGKTQVTIDQDNFTSFALKGTLNNETLSEFERNLSLYKYNILTYQGQQQQVYMEAMQQKDETKMQQILLGFKKLQEDEQLFISNYLSQHQTSLTALYYLYFTSKEDLSQLKMVYENLSETDKKSNLAQLVAGKIK